MHMDVSSHDLELASQKFKQASGDTDQMSADLRKTVEALMSDWKGMASQRFQQEWEMWVKASQLYSDVLVQMSQSLNACATRVEQIEKAGGLG